MCGYAGMPASCVRAIRTAVMRTHAWLAILAFTAQSCDGWVRGDGEMERERGRACGGRARTTSIRVAKLAAGRSAARDFVLRGERCDGESYELREESFPSWAVYSSAVGVHRQCGASHVCAWCEYGVRDACVAPACPLIDARATPTGAVVRSMCRAPLQCRVLTCVENLMHRKLV